MKQRIQKYLRKLPKRRTKHFEGFCPNCEHPVNGNFCSNCGQSTKSFQRPFLTVVSESVGDALSMDNRLIHTLIPLFAKPGFLTREFMNGRRARYTPPFRLYLFLTFFAFMLLTYNHKPDIPGNNTVAGDSTKNEKLDMISFLDDLVKDEEYNRTDSIKSDSSKKFEIKNGILTYNLSDKEAEKVNGIVAQNDLITYKNDSIVTKKAKKDWQEIDEQIFGSDDVKKLIKMWKLNPALMMDAAFKKLSQTLLLILPLFALFLAFMYIRRKHYMLEHLLISLNFHSFIFVIVILSELLLMLNYIWLEPYAFYLYLLIPINLFLVMKFYYKQSWVKTFFKWIIVSFVYNILLFTGLILGLVSMVA
jgi:hypothetical protein